MDRKDLHLDKSRKFNKIWKKINKKKKNREKFNKNRYQNNLKSLKILLKKKSIKTSIIIKNYHN